MRYSFCQATDYVLASSKPARAPRASRLLSQWLAMCILAMAAACDQAPTAPETPAALVSSEKVRSIVVSGPEDCPAGWTWHWDGHCRAPGDDGGGGGGSDGGGQPPSGGGGGGPANGGVPAPEGISPEEWGDLTNAERQLIIDEPTKWIPRYNEMKEIRSLAISESLRLTQTTTDNDGSRQNAFQHAIWAAKMASAYGYIDAKKWTDAHEDRQRPLTVSEELWNQHKQMDLRNNEIGLGYFWNPQGSESDWAWAHQAQLCWIEGDGARSCL